MFRLGGDGTGGGGGDNGLADGRFRRARLTAMVIDGAVLLRDPWGTHTSVGAGLRLPHITHAREYLRSP